MDLDVALNASVVLRGLQFSGPSLVLSGFMFYRMAWSGALAASRRVAGPTITPPVLRVDPGNCIALPLSVLLTHALRGPDSRQNPNHTEDAGDHPQPP